MANENGFTRAEQNMLINNLLTIHESFKKFYDACAAKRGEQHFIHTDHYDGITASYEGTDVTVEIQQFITNPYAALKPLDVIQSNITFVARKLTEIAA